MKQALTFPIGQDTEVTVRSFDELTKWLETERREWAWMSPTNPETERHGLASELQSAWNNLVSNVMSIRDQGRDLADTEDHLLSLTSSIITVSTTVDGLTVLDIRESVGDAAAMAALGFLKRRLTSANSLTRDEMPGVMLSVFPDLRDATEWTQRLKRERVNFRVATSNLMKRVDDEALAREERARELTDRLRGIAKRVFNTRRKAWSTTQIEWAASAAESVSRIEEEVNEALTSIRGTEASFREFMRLKAPVEYWQTKAADHGRREAEARRRLYWYFPVTLTIISFAFVVSGFILIRADSVDQGQAPFAFYLVVSGGLLFVSTLAFWIGRLLTKLYLSEHHLRNDAEERATMTTTYLALTGENAAEEADRHIILNALFRATPDGIVKEDGPGDIGLQGLLAKNLMR